MRTLGILSFELRQRARQVSSYLYFLVLFGAGLGVMLAVLGWVKGVAVYESTTSRKLNSEYGLLFFTSLISPLATSIVAAVFGRAALQDHEARIQPLLFTTGLSKLNYLLSRYASALLFSLLLFSGIGLGFWAAPLLPGIDRSRFGPDRWLAYLWPYVVLVLPNLLSLGAFFFCLGTLARSMVPVHVSALVLLIGSLMSGGLLNDLDLRTLGALVDPFGSNALKAATIGRTAGEYGNFVGLQGLLLANRLLWVWLGCCALGFTILRYRFEQAPQLGRERRAVVAELAGPPPGLAAPVPTLAFSWPRLLLRLSWLGLRETVKNRSFLVILGTALAATAIAALNAESSYGTRIYPLTRWMVELCSMSFLPFFLIVITLYSGELLFREREARMEALSDALPVPSWLFLASKLLSLLGLQVLLMSTLLLSSILVQTLSGYHRLELGLYFQELFGLSLVDYWLLCVLTLTVHAFVQHKYLGHLLVSLVYAGYWLLAELELTHPLYVYGSSPSRKYSDMNGYGHLLGPVRWFQLYWVLAAALLGVLLYLLWQRGAETSWRARLRAARARFTPALARVTGAFALAFSVLGGFLYYNTNIVHRYYTASDVDDVRADYERQYAALAQHPQPRIRDVRLDFDLYPEQQRLRSRGRYLLQNASTESIPTIHVSLASNSYERLSVGQQAAPSRSDARLGLYSFELAEPLRPGATIELAFELETRSVGFSNEREQLDVVENGTRFSTDQLPAIGYQPGRQLEGARARAKRGLPPALVRPPEDLAARGDNYVTANADWVSFEGTVSTAADQTALLPGYLQREWREGERRFFHYRMDHPILYYFTLLSARYQVLRDSWEGVPLEIYYHPGHEYNLARMMQAMKDALSYCSEAFGPYQHRQLRIAEFPRYHTVAQSFPNTISYSEAAGFVARVDPEDPTDIDYPYYITAHEVAHQWWAHQVLGGNVQGARLLSEGMAQYSALMVMAKTFGAERMQRFLRYELDSYLRSRSSAKRWELPLALDEGLPFVHYQKAGLALFALQDYIGEANLNRAARGFLEAHRFQGPPYPSSRDLLGYLRQETPPQLHELFDDLFERVIELNNRTRSASYRTLADGRYELTVRYQAVKQRPVATGSPEALPLAELIEFGAFDEHGNALKLEKHWVREPEGEVRLLLDARPAKAGIDPRNLLIDRVPQDNLVDAKPAPAVVSQL